MGKMIYKTNKKGWIKIAEAFFAVLLLAGISLVVLNNNQNKNIDTVSSPVETFETSLIREIELDSVLREEILATSGEMEWDAFPTEAPLTKTKIENEVPGFLECTAKICSVSSSCVLIEDTEKSIYVHSVIITANGNQFNPRMLKVFCSNKN